MSKQIIWTALMALVWLMMPLPDPAPRTSSVVWHGKGETGSCKHRRSKAERTHRRAIRRGKGRE